MTRTVQRAAKGEARATPASMAAPARDVRLGAPDDAHEREADRIADAVVSRGAIAQRLGDGATRLRRQVEPEEEEVLQTAPEHLQRQPYEDEDEETLQLKAAPGAISRQGAAPAAAGVIASGGRSLGRVERAFFEPRFGRDLSQVRLHTGADAASAARDIGARAYTLRNHIGFAAGAYDPASTEGRRLIAHELTHTLQQSSEGTVRRAVELRPPGRGEASAFDRAGELVDRLNDQSDAIEYVLNGRVLEYTVLDAGKLRDFDRRMIAFIDDPQTVPMRLITSAGRVGGSNLFVDSFISGYVDLDDMLASDDVSFRMNVIHILTERFEVPDYDRKIGTNFGARFDAAHEAGNEAEAEHLQAVLGDPTIRFTYEETRPNGTTVFGFDSDEGYRVFHIFRGSGSAVRGGILRVRKANGDQVSLEEFMRERAAAAAGRAVRGAAAAGEAVGP